MIFKTKNKTGVTNLLERCRAATEHRVAVLGDAEKLALYILFQHVTESLAVYDERNLRLGMCVVRGRHMLPLQSLDVLELTSEQVSH